MRMRLGFIMGLGTGYVLGTKAGQERYEQIRSLASQFMEGEAARKVKQRAADAFEQAKRTAFGPDGARTIRLDGAGQTPAPAQEPFTTAGLSEAP